MNNRVPDGWSYNLLSSLENIDKESLKGSTDHEYKFRYIDIGAVSTGKVSIPNHQITFSDAPSRARKKIKFGDVLMSTVRPNLKSFAHFTEKGNDFMLV